MKKKLIKKTVGALSAVLFFLSLQACQTINSGEQPTPPDIDEDLTTQEALDAGITFGGETLGKVKKLFSRRKEWPTVNRLLEKRLIDRSQDYENLHLVNALNIYQSSTSVASPRLFVQLVRHDNKNTQALAWNLAANMPSQDIARSMDDELTRRVQKNEEDEVLSPQFASALIANRLVTGYSFARRGLMLKGDDIFAKAMIALKPNSANLDFMNYLAMASIEELRQLNQQSVNVYTCVVILQHLARFGAPLNHEHSNYLFLYSVSRNKALADLALEVLMVSLPQNKNQLALMLSRLPSWVQVAFVESVRENITPKFNSFLSELKEVTPHQDVIDEIREIRQL